MDKFSDDKTFKKISVYIGPEKSHIELWESYDLQSGDKVIEEYVGVVVLPVVIETNEGKHKTMQDFRFAIKASSMKEAFSFYASEAEKFVKMIKNKTEKNIYIPSSAETDIINSTR